MIRKFLILLSFCFYTSWALGWSAIGHRVITQIAYDHLRPDVKQKVILLIKQLVPEYPDTATLNRASFWADSLKGHDVTAFNSWHIINIPFSPDGTRLLPINPENVVWAIRQSEQVLRSDKSNTLEKALFLRFLIHFVGDIHQPLHCTSRVTRAHPQGDMGGNLFLIHSAQANNLHMLWDHGVGLFDGIAFSSHSHFQQIRRLARLIESHYPESTFGNRIKETDPAIWAKESFQIAKHFAYNIKENSTPSKAYVQQAQQIVAKRIALAGYRLAYTLNQIYG